MTIFHRVKKFLGLSKRKRFPRERFLLPKEWHLLQPALQSKPDKVRVYFSLLLLEGARMSELRLAQWSHMDLEAGLWHKTKTKNGRRQLLPLSPASCDLLRQLPHTGPYIFPGESPDKPWSRTAVRHWWRKLRWEAGCPDVQIRDLRRTCATWLVQGGENLMVIKELLHHSSVSTTQIYAKADLASQQAALARHSQRVFPPSSKGDPMPLMIVLFILLTGCMNISTQIQPSNPDVKPLLKGSDCVPIIFGLGAGDATLEQAMLQGRTVKREIGNKTQPIVPIRAVHNIQASDFMLLFFGSRCVDVTGEP